MLGKDRFQSYAEGRSKSWAAAAQFALSFSNACDLSGPAIAEFVPWAHSAYLYWGFYLKLERKHDPSAFCALLDQFPLFFAIVSGNVVLFLVMLHQSWSEETLWLTRSLSLGTCSRNASPK